MTITPLKRTKRVYRQRPRVRTDEALKKIKNSYPTTEISKTENPGALVMGEYRCLKTSLVTPITQTSLQSLAQKLIAWSFTDDALHLSEFHRQSGVPRATFYTWVHRDPELKEALATALDMVGARREVGAITRKFDTSAVWRRLYQFSPEYREAMEFNAKLAKREEMDQGGTKIVVIEKMITDPSMEKYFKGSEEKKDAETL